MACGVGFLSHSARRRTATYPTWTNRESAATPRLLHDRFVDVVYRSGVDNESQQQQQLTISDQQLVRHSMLNSEKQRFVDCGPRYSHTTPRTARAGFFCTSATEAAASGLLGSLLQVARPKRKAGRPYKGGLLPLPTHNPLREHPCRQQCSATVRIFFYLK